MLSALVASKGAISLRTGLLIGAAFLGARTCANALNRVIDRRIDAANPRTASRHIPEGTVSSAEALTVAAASFAALTVSAFFLNPLCVALLPLAGALFVFYSFTKRFTWLCHLVLGVTCAGASVGAWIAVLGGIDWPVLVLAAANAAWVAGFDVIYAIQDIDFDRGAKLHSIPARFGRRIALAVACAFHAGAVCALIAFGLFVGLSLPYFVSTAAIALLLLWSLYLAYSDYERKTLFASYSANQIVSFVLLVGSSFEFFVLKTKPEWLSIKEVITRIMEFLP